METLHAYMESFPPLGLEEEEPPAYVAAAERYGDLEQELDSIPADALAGILAKIRALDLPGTGTALNPACHNIMVSVTEDVTRLHAAGTLA